MFCFTIDFYAVQNSLFRPYNGKKTLQSSFLNHEKCNEMAK